MSWLWKMAHKWIASSGLWKIVLSVSKMGTYVNLSVRMTRSFVPAVLFLLLSNRVPSTFSTGSTFPHFAVKYLFRLASEFKDVNGFFNLLMGCSKLFLFSVSCEGKHWKAASLAWLWISKNPSFMDKTKLFTADWLIAVVEQQRHTYRECFYWNFRCCRSLIYVICHRLSCTD